MKHSISGTHTFVVDRFIFLRELREAVAEAREECARIAESCHPSWSESAKLASRMHAQEIRALGGAGEKAAPPSLESRVKALELHTIDHSERVKALESWRERIVKP